MRLIPVVCLLVRGRTTPVRTRSASARETPWSVAVPLHRSWPTASLPRRRWNGSTLARRRGERRVQAGSSGALSRAVIEAELYEPLLPAAGTLFA